jgi:hypothetical protein
MKRPRVIRESNEEVLPSLKMVLNTVLTNPTKLITHTVTTKA